MKQTGDGFLATFSSVSGALRACSEIQSSLANYNAEDPAIEIHVRMGLNIGEATEEAGDVYGIAVNLASRIAAHAEPDQVLVSAVIPELAPGKEFSFLDKGKIMPKGFDHPVAIYELKWSIRPETPAK